MLQQEVLVKFGFPWDPFINEIRDPAEDYYVTEGARWVERNLDRVIDGKGFAALVGPTGAGKSTLIDRIIATKKNLALAKPRMCDTESLHAGAIYDAIVYDFTEEPPKRSREARARQMIHALVAKQEARQHAVLIVEEAHRLHVTTLRALKSFYDEKLHGRRLLSIVLVGQEPLKEKIQRADMLEISRRCQIMELHGFTRKKNGKDTPPTATVIRTYLDKKFGTSGIAVGKVFNEEALAALATRSGVPLELHVLASAAMTTAWETGAKVVNKEIVNDC